MMMRARRDGGETLIEVLFTIVIVSLTFTALFTSLATAGNAGNVQRASVQADYVMRNYAEAIKFGAQSCTTAVNKTYTVTYVPPTGFTPSAVPTDKLCPPLATPKLLQLKVIAPLGLVVTMQITVGTP